MSRAAATHSGEALAAAAAAAASVHAAEALHAVHALHVGHVGAGHGADAAAGGRAGGGDAATAHSLLRVGTTGQMRHEVVGQRCVGQCAADAMRVSALFTYTVVQFMC